MHVSTISVTDEILGMPTRQLLCHQTLSQPYHLIITPIIVITFSLMLAVFTCISDFRENVNLFS